MKKTRRRADGAGFWDRPGVMHMVADLLTFAATIALGYAAVVALVRLPFFPLREVVVSTPLRHVAAPQLEYVARRFVVGNFFTVDLESVRQAFEKLPWVRRVQVRRLWPNGIELAIEEHQAVATWGQGDGEPRLVSPEGEVFTASVAADLPRLAGPEGSAPEVLNRYQEFSQMLAPIRRKPESVVLSSRLAWKIRLDDGLIIELGRDQPKSPAGERLQRLVSVFPELVARLPFVPAVIDLRYPNGFAARAAGNGTESKNK